MKTINELSKEQKAKDFFTRMVFFAQYFGVKEIKVGKGELYLTDPDFYLELTPLSKMTDEHAIEYFNILWSEDHYNKSNDFKIQYGKDWANAITSQRYGLIPSKILNGIDYLRSKGYAIPFMNYSVDDLVELGWVKLLF